MRGFSLWRYEMRATVTRPAPLFLSFFIPLVLLVIVGFSLQPFFQDDQQPIKAAIVDHDRTFETKSLVNQLSDEERMKKALTLTPMSENNALKAFEQGNIAGIMTIPKGFTDSLRVGENEPIQVLTNEDKPLDATMLQVLLKSGAHYISASQSAVNTVYDLHIKQLPQGERSQTLQGAIVTFTLFALDRNEAFQEELVSGGTSLGWKNHGIIGFTLTFVIMFLILFQTFDQSTQSPAIQMRWKMLNVTFLHQVVVKQLKWWLLSFLLMELVFLLIHLTIGDLPYSIVLHAAFLLITLCLTGIVSVFYSMKLAPSIRFLSLSLIAFIGLLSAGVWVPGLYLPDWIQWSWSPFGLCYELLKVAFIEGDFSGVVSLGLYVLVLMALAIFLGYRKEKRDAYVSIFAS